MHLQKTGQEEKQEARESFSEKEKNLQYVLISSSFTTYKPLNKVSSKQ
jgi:hypothetical protein